MTEPAPVTPFPRVDPRLRLAVGVAVLLAVALFAFVLFVGQIELGERRGGSDFYDAQARSWFDGRWDVPREVLSIEAFEIDGKTYTYFGPVPALLRAPVLLVTDRFDGRLSQPSMLMAFIVALVATAQLTWRARVLVRGPGTMRWPEAAAGGVLVFALGTGTTLLYLASQAVVYHEAILWSVAFALVSFGGLVGFLRHPDRRSLGVAAIFAMLAFLTRGSVGSGPVVALALVFGVYLIAVVGGRARGWSGDAPAPLRWLVPALRLPVPPRHLAALAVAVLAPVTVYSAVNMAKFGSPYEIPVDRQVFSDIDPARQAALADNDGSLFGLRYVPTTAWQYLRPDSIDIEPVAPYVEFPRRQPTVVGDVTFDTFDESSSMTATMPLLVVLGIVGLGAVLLAPVGDGPGLRALRIPAAGAAVGAATMLTIAFVAHRYLGDALPLLILLGVAGYQWLVARLGGVPRWLVVIAASIGVLLAMWGTVVNLSLALEYQRLIAPAAAETRYDFVRSQYESGGTHRVVLVDAVPPVGPRGTLAIVGDCDALLWSDGYSWYPLEGRVGPGGPIPGVTPGADDEVQPADDDGLCRILLDRVA